MHQPARESGAPKRTVPAVCGAEFVIGVPRRQWIIRGQVQGVGFRPFVYRAATDAGLGGWVRNEVEGVTIEGWGPKEALDRFELAMRTEPPTLAVIDRIESRNLEPLDGCGLDFEIIESERAGPSVGRVTVDSATCSDCLRELRDATDRRRRHPMINCTNCGPRYTIIRDLPYDRGATTMAGFSMCAACAHEYGDPGDRRFHAQPTCCRDCGPRVSLVDGDGVELPGDPIAESAALLGRGGILAIKGVGGYHLAVDARNPEAVARLRERKGRDHKPFAVMVSDVDSARVLVELTEASEGLMGSPACPIVLAPARRATGIAPGVAPGSHRLGVMVAYTPIHHLLFGEGVGPLVMTSANLSDDPLAKSRAEMDDRLVDVFDGLLGHERPIERAVDDSIVIDTGRRPLVVRRSRGYVPTPVALPLAASRPGLCVGAELKNTVALVRGDHTILGQHVGDLTHTLAYTRFRRVIDDLRRLFDIEPEWIACDLHPGYLSRRHAVALAREWGVALLGVQHHHAHLASLLGEHRRTDRIIGLACDGVGYGVDGTAWGGEVLVGDLRVCERVGRLRPLRLPGGDAAARQTGRCGVAWLYDLRGGEMSDDELVSSMLPVAGEREMVAMQLERGLNCPMSSGAGRLFDSAAAVLGICAFNHYEAMSGQLLESAAVTSASRPSGEGLMPVERAGDLLEIDHRPLLARLLRGLESGEPREDLAWLFHDALASGLAESARVVSGSTGLLAVGLTGGVFCNVLLSDLVRHRLERLGLEVLTHGDVPANDGGLSYGQAAIAAARLEGESDVLSGAGSDR